jgi:hypothetical protein
VAVPAGLLGLLAKRWEVAVLIGAGVFITFLFLDQWASRSYWMAIVPVSGIAA